LEVGGRMAGSCLEDQKDGNWCKYWEKFVGNWTRGDLGAITLCSLA
jgi:hypothetical protein